MSDKKQFILLNTAPDSLSFAAKNGFDFEMVAYSGQVIENHFAWGNLLIDLSGLRFERSRYPVLEDHNTDKKLGFSGKPGIKEFKSNCFCRSPGCSGCWECRYHYQV